MRVKQRLQGATRHWGSGEGVYTGDDALGPSHSKRLQS